MDSKLFQVAVVVISFILEGGKLPPFQFLRKVI